MILSFKDSVRRLRDESWLIKSNLLIWRISESFNPCHCSNVRKMETILCHAQWSISVKLIGYCSVCQWKRWEIASSCAWLSKWPGKQECRVKKRLQKHFKLELRNVPMKSDRFQISLGIKMLSTQWRIKSSTRSVN